MGRKGRKKGEEVRKGKEEEQKLGCRLVRCMRNRLGRY